MDNQASPQEGPPKKGPLESLNREELMKKCKGLLVLAQKAKQSKDEFAEENKRLKEEISNFETQKDADKKSLFAMKEIVEALTENKLTLAGEVADQKARCDRLQNELQKFEQVAIENEALKRQLKRLEDENEELLGDLDTMEKKLDQVNQFGIQQQKDLVLLEKETEKWNSLQHTVDALRNAVKNKESENEILINKCKTLEEELSGQKYLEEAQNLKVILANSQELIATLQAEKTDLASKVEGIAANSQAMESYERTIESQTLEIDQLKTTNQKHMARLQLFKIKIMEFSLKLKNLRKSREVLIETVQEYAQSVPKWQKEIMNASDHISQQLMAVESERKGLQEEVVRLRQQQLQRMEAKQSCENIYIDAGRVEELKTYCREACSEYQQIIEELATKNAENHRLQTQLSELNDNLTRTKAESEDKTKDIEGLQRDIAALTQKLNKTLGTNAEESNVRDELKQKLHQYELDCAEKERELDLTLDKLNEITEQHNKAIEESKEKDSEIRHLKDQWESISDDLARLNKKHESTIQLVEDQKASTKKTIKQLQDEIAAKTSQLKNLEQEKNNLITSLNEKNSLLEQLQSSLSMRETENGDLLAEMRELNEAFKGRGDVISRQQDKIKELEADVLRTSDKLANIEGNLSERNVEIVAKESQISIMNQEIVSAKDEVASLVEQAKQNEFRIKSLSDEVSTMRDKHDTQSEVISTSTISRVEEVARLREVDDSLEEKYNKLRALAVKLKRKVQEQAGHITILENENRRTSEEKNEITAKLKVKNLQALQNENDKLLDEVEKLKAENRVNEKQLKSLESEVAELRNVSGIEKAAKSKFDTTVKEFQNQIKCLKQEKDSMNVIRKEVEKERDMLKQEIAKKSDELSVARAHCDKFKSELERKRSAEKQSSVLNLEIEAYEKSLNDVTHKLNKSKVTVKELKEDIASKESTIASLNSQLGLLEDSIESEKAHSIELKQQNNIQHTKLKESEHEKLELRTEIQDKTQECENLKLEVDALQLQLSAIASDREKLCTALQTEKEKLLRNVCNLEETLENSKIKLKATEHELEDLRAEYASYKIKAQSVLRQNQSKESSRERELEEELNATKAASEAFEAKWKTAVELIAGNEKKLEELRQDNERIQRRCKEVIAALDESREQNDQLMDDSRKHNKDYQESLKTHRLQIDTLNNCYKKQLEDLEKKYKNEIEEIGKRGAQANDNKSAMRIGPFGGPVKPTNDEQKIDLILMEREDAEGSETTSVGTVSRRKSSATKTRHEPIPLEDLLTSSLDDLENEEVRSVTPTLELQQTKEKLHKQECRVKHLTALLAENEQDLARLTQLNELLKEEVRRQERSLEREPHVQNSEYLKNVVLKFLTLNSGDERSRLVPVLNTILKLSPEETHSLQTVAAGGDSGSRTWGSFLPIWSNHQ